MHLTASASADVEEVGVVGQVWWWVLLAVVVVAALLAVLLLRRHGHAQVLSEQTGIAAAAAGGVGGAVGAAGVVAAATQARRDEVRTDDREMQGPQDDTEEPRSVEAKEQRSSAPDPADSALAALDSGRAEAHTEPGAGAAAAVAAAVTRPGPHEGSVLPAADGSAPADDYPIKANADSGKYYTPDSPYYVRTRADLWFRSPADAEKAGFALWDGERRAGRET